MNTFDLPVKTASPGTSLVLQDPATGKRDRALGIGDSVRQAAAPVRSTAP